MKLEGVARDLLLSDLRQIAELPRMVEEGETEAACRVLERLFFRAYTYAPPSDPDALWEEVPVNLDACYTLYLRGLGQALQSSARDGDAFAGILLCLRLLPPLVGAVLDEIDSGAPALHDPMVRWCHGFDGYQLQDSRAALDDLFPLSQEEAEGGEDV